jgi:hypothetical protein
MASPNFEAFAVGADLRSKGTEAPASLRGPTPSERFERNNRLYIPKP